MDKDLLKQFNNLNKRLDTIVSVMATKKDLEVLEKNLKVFAVEQQEELARLVSASVVEPLNKRFDNLEDRKDIETRMKAFDRKFTKLEETLHIRL